MMALILLPLLFLYSYGNAFNTLANKKILIVQNKGGGHGAIGFHLCKDILLNEPTAEIAILQDKCDSKKEPFASYSELESLGVKVRNTNSIVLKY